MTGSPAIETAQHRPAVAAAVAAGELSVQGLHHRLDIAQVHFRGVRFGNLNTPADLSAAGFAPG